MAKTSNILNQIGPSLYLLNFMENVFIFLFITRGEDDEKKSAFRKWFACVGELRALFPEASVMALSATCKKKDYKKVMKLLHISDDAVTVRVSPNKSNIKLIVKKIESVETDFLGIVEAAEENRMPRTLIYCSSIKDVSLVYNYLVGEISNAKVFIGMFHS